MSDVHSMTDEILKMKHFDHPNVMTLIGVCVSVGGGPAIVMPFMENGSLLNYLRRDKKNITIKDDQDLETVSCTYVAVYHSQCPQCDSSRYSTPTSRNRNSALFVVVYPTVKMLMEHVGYIASYICHCGCYYSHNFTFTSVHGCNK